MFVDPLFKLMAEKQASDLFFTAGAPIQIKINGVVMPVNAQVLDPAAVKKIAYEVMNEQQIQDYEKTWEMNFAVGRQELGSFRVNVFKQRGAVAMVIRFIKPNIPTVEELKLPPVCKEIVMEKLGMRQEGTLREHFRARERWWSSHLYAVLDSEYRKKRG